MKVVIIGTGNVATVMGKKIQEAGHEIIQVVGRHFEKAESLAAYLFTRAAYNVRYINLDADIYIIAVSDTAIPAVASQLNLKDKLVVHTAAAVSKNVLSECSEKFGVLYPLQSLVKDIPLTSSIPVLIDGNDETTQLTLKEFAVTWAEQVRTAGDEERIKLHIAAVFAGNFSNFLFTVAEQYCRHEHLKFNLLYPLIEETVNRVKIHAPSTVQTGPAVREDNVTISRHLEMLNNYPEMKNLYNDLTSIIVNAYTKSST